MGLLSSALWRYSSHHNRLIYPHLDAQQYRREMRRTLIMPGIFMLSIGLAFITNQCTGRYRAGDF
jgi:hypothetical protein